MVSPFAIASPYSGITGAPNADVKNHALDYRCFKLATYLLIVSSLFSSGRFAAAQFTSSEKNTGIMSSRTLSGSIRAVENDTGLQGIIVEEIGPDQETVLQSSVTDQQGLFSLSPSIGSNIHEIRLHAQNGRVMRIRVVVSADSLSATIRVIYQLRAKLS